MRSTLTLLVGMFFLLNGYSQAPDSISLLYDEIVISEKAINLPFNDNSRNIEIITKDQIQSLNANNINALLQMVSGVDLRQRGVFGVQSDISIRGGTFEQTLILLNGVKLIDPQTGHHAMNIPLDVNDIERIEILKGSSSRIYGLNAFAGAVNIVTKVSDEQAIKFVGEFGQNNLFNGYVSASFPIRNYKQKIAFGTTHSDGYRFNSDFEIVNAHYQSEVKIGKGKLNLLGGYVDRKFGANGFYGNESFTDQYEEVQTGFIDVRYVQSLRDWNLEYGFNWRNNKDNWQFRREDPEFFQNFHTSNVYNGIVNASKGHKLGILGMGIDYSVFDLTSSNLSDHNRKQVSFHLENRFLLLGEKLDITPGVLLMDVSDFGFEIFPGLDVGFKFDENFKLFSNIGWTTRLPSYTDLFYQDSGNVGNPNLQEERAFSSEIGLKVQSASSYAQASFFMRKAQDQIDWFRETEDEKWMPDNFSQAIYKGFELSGIYHFSNVFKSLQASYTFIDAQFEENDFAFSRNQLENLKHQFVLIPQFEIGPLDIVAQFKYNDRVSLENYYTINLNLNYNFSESRKIFVRALNVTDQIYRETNLVEMPGRWVSAGFRWQL